MIPSAANLSTWVVGKIPVQSAGIENDSVGTGVVGSVVGSVGAAESEVVGAVVGSAVGAQPASVTIRSAVVTQSRAADVNEVRYMIKIYPLGWSIPVQFG